MSIFFSGCESKGEKALRIMKNLAKEHIDDLNNANSKEEVDRICKEYKERGEFELKKITDKETDREIDEKMDEYARDMKWEDIQYIKELGKEIEDARRNAYNRFR